MIIELLFTFVIGFGWLYQITCAMVLPIFKSIFPNSLLGFITRMIVMNLVLVVVILVDFIIIRSAFNRSAHVVLFLIIKLAFQ